jgi:hypothetical protein
MRRENEVNAAPTPQHIAAPRFAAGWAALVYAVATLTFAWPAFAGRFLVAFRSDQFKAGYAFREFAAQSLRSGSGFPEWNAYLLGGMPYVAAMHGDIFYPTFLLRMIMPTDVAMTWGFIIHIFLSGFFTYGFLRAWGLGFYGSLLGGLAYMMSGPIAAYVSPGHDGKLFVSALFPLTLWMLVRLVRDGRVWAWGALAMTIGLAVLSPHPQLLQYLLLASGSFALFLVLSGDTKLPRDVGFKRLGLALGAVIIGGFIGALQYLPVRHYVDWSPRAGGKGWDHAVSYSMPTEELLNAFVPEFSGILDSYWGSNLIHFHSEYPGIVVLVLAGAGFLAHQVASRGFRWFWTGTFIVSLLWTLGGSTPFYKLVYAIVPGTKFFRAPSTMMYVTMFSIAVFAALGTERILKSKPSRAFFVGWGIAIVAIAALMAAGLPSIVAEGIASRMSGIWPTEWTTRTIDAARANQGAVLLGALRSIAFVGAALGLIWLIGERRVAPRTGAWLFAGLIALDLWIIEHRYWIFTPSARETFATDQIIQTLQRQPEPGRVITWDALGTTRSNDPAFYDGLMVHRIRVANGYHGNELGRYEHLYEQEAAKNPVPQLGRIALTPGYLRHENVRYLYTTLPDTFASQLTGPMGWLAPATKILGPVKNARGNDIYLYRLPGDNPAAWLASVIVKAPDDQALMFIMDSRFDPLRAAVMDTAAPVQAVQLTTAPPVHGVQARVTRYEPGAIDVQLDKAAPAGSALVVSENFYPGWTASADGKPAVTARANYNLIGVALPTGARSIQLRFQDRAYHTGKIVTLVALLVSLTAIVVGVLRDRRPASVAA